jgi:hypothetical protein
MYYYYYLIGGDVFPGSFGFVREVLLQVESLSVGGLRTVVVGGRELVDRVRNPAPSKRSHSLVPWAPCCWIRDSARNGETWKLHLPNEQTLDALLCGRIWKVGCSFLKKDLRGECEWWGCCWGHLRSWSGRDWMKKKMRQQKDHQHFPLLTEICSFRRDPLLP